MTRILVYTSPARGHLYPIAPIMLELQRRGHQVALRTLASQVELMRGLGIDAAPISERVEGIELNDYRGRSQPAKGIRALTTFAARAKREVPDLAAAIETERPDALLIDCMTWGAASVTEASGLPWAQFVPYPLPMPSRDAPPFGPGLRPARGPVGRLRDRAMRPFAAAMFDRTALESLNAIRLELGVPALLNGSDVFALAPLVLYLTSEPFEYPRSDWPGAVRMVGPCAWDPPAAPPVWLAQVERPLVVVSTSSERQEDRRLVTTALEAFAGEEVEVVATLPADGAQGIEVPSNAHVERFLAHGPLLAKAACAITHGGAGVTQKALAAGVPVCVVPFGRDQHEVARRVEVAGAGSRLSVRRLTPARLRAKAYEAMRMRAGARRVSDAFAAAGGPAAAADAFELLVRDPSPTALS
ncbi:MAG TPA: glycosyltransferase [Solirubrobacteraceae bacterium]|jgi:MGT family glycosyltransferase|nr:glycosyltransferase [Solirubrobacteraceae bacterium]